MQASEATGCDDRAKFNFHTILDYIMEWQFNSYQEQKKEEGNRKKKHNK